MFVRRRSVLPSRALVVASLAVLAASPLRAQEASEIVVDTIDVEVVNVEVVVTDRAGNPVRGLTRDDFVVREDGEPVELTNFYAVEGGQRALSEASIEPGPAAETHSPLPADQRLNLVVMIDDLNTPPTLRSGFLKELQGRLDAVLRPGDRVLVATAGPEVRVVQPFTDDHAAVSETLDRLRPTVPRGGMLTMIERDIRDEIARGEPDVLDDIRTFADNKHSLNLRLLGTLHRFVEALAGLPGRRAVLYASGGIALRPAEALMEEWYQTFAARPGTRAIGAPSPQSEADNWNATSDLVRLTEAAAGNQVAFYTLETASVFHGGLDPEVRLIGPPTRTSDLMKGGGLADLAWRTGGSAALNGGSLDVLLERMASDYRDYYSLGYRSRHSNDGEYHRLSVEVPGRKVRTRHTLGFRATTPEQQTIERTMSALVFDEPDNPLDVRVEVGRAEAEKRKRYVLPILVRIPISSLTLLPGETRYQGKVSVVVAVQDRHGGLSEPQLLDVPVEIPNDRLREAIGLQVAKGINLLLEKGESKLAVGVRDELSGTTSTLNVDLSVGGGG